MIDKIRAVLEQEGINRIGMLDLNECDIINRRILPTFAKSVIMICIPYRSTTEQPDDGFSEYARIYDYHNYARSLFERTIPKLKEITGYLFEGFCDHSPINEKLAAAKSGLGVIGRNSLFIDKEYGSYVFLATIVTDAENNIKTYDIENCINCKKCVMNCPNNAILDIGIDRFKCLSGISQKKTKSDNEIALLKEHNIVWGCDICQNVCPYNINSKISPIKYFSETRIKHITKEFIESLSDDEFNKYAFSYKGRKIVINNIEFDTKLT